MKCKECKALNKNDRNCMKCNLIKNMVLFKSGEIGCYCPKTRIEKELNERRHIYMHEITISIIDKFEELLDSKSIDIPCYNKNEEKERKEDNNSARIYGTEYYELESAISNLIYTDKII